MSYLKYKRAFVIFFLFLLIICLTTAVFANQPRAIDTDYYVYLPIIRKPAVIYGPNILPNPSFEAGWYHPQGISELQIPDKWQFTWLDQNDPPLDPRPENVWRRPEVRVLSPAFLPPEEHALFIWDGNQTVKVFKGYGSVSFEFSNTIILNPGNYIFAVNVFPDLVVGYNNGQKVYAPDPLSGEVKLSANSGTTGWVLPTFGQKNKITYQFTVTQRQSVTLKAAMRGRWAIQNNGWFLDDWGLYTVTVQ